MSVVRTHTIKPATPFCLSLRSARFIHFAFAVAVFLQIYILFMVVRMLDPKPATDHNIAYYILAFCVSGVLITLLVRDAISSRAIASLRSAPEDKAACRQWRSAQIMTSGAFYSLFLFGWVLAFLRQPGWTYAALWVLCAGGFYYFVPTSPFE